MTILKGLLATLCLLCATPVISSDDNGDLGFQGGVRLQKFAQDPEPYQITEQMNLLGEPVQQTWWNRHRVKVLCVLGGITALVSIGGPLAFGVACSFDIQNTNGTGWCGPGGGSPTDGPPEDIPARGLG